MLPGVIMEGLVQRLDQLLAGICETPLNAEQRGRLISGIFDDSRRVMAGGLFVAVAGTSADGRQFITDALQRGAAVIVGEDLPQGSVAPFFNVPDARAALARLAARWYRLDDVAAPRIKLAGVTGTNGKSTSAFMTAAILRAAGLKCGLLGTVQYDLCGRTVTANMTTPGPIELAGYLAECVANGADAVVMEVSSHALDQKRTAGLHFATAAFTNLTGDHLDYHGTIENYAEAKRLLFSGLSPDAVAVVNSDDPFHRTMIAGCRASVVRYAIDDAAAEIRATLTRSTVKGTYFRMQFAGFDQVLENGIVGRHNVYNALTAAGMARALGASNSAIVAGLAAVRNIPGRLQRVPSVSGADVFVDYAHTDDALSNVLSVLKPLTRRRLITVFGCGGDRDRTKRPRMARAVAEHANCIIVTSDNPRTEDPRSIIDQILTGFSESDRRRVRVEPDRGRAIRAAIAGAAEGDVVLIAGKGHEDYQIVGTEKVHFDDVEAAIQAAAELARSPVGAA